MGIVLLCGYALLIARIVCKGGTGIASFFVNNRSGSALEVAFSIIVSCIGASAAIGMTGMAFQLGTPAFWWLGMGAAGLTLLALLLARNVRQSGAYTMPQLVERYLGASSRPLISLLIVVAWMAILAAQFSAVAGVIGGLTGFSPVLCLGIGFMLIALHSLGGQEAIMRLDRVQAVLLISALLLLLGWLCAHNPNWTETVRFEAVNIDFPPERLLYFLLVVGANYLVCPMLFGRLLSAESAGSARRGALLAAGGIAGCAALIVAVGLACRGLIPADTPQDAVLNTVLAEVLPAWMHLPVSLALLSAIVSSADSCLITAATVLSHDLLHKKDPAVGKACVLGLGLTGLAISFWGKGILGFLLMAYDIYACGVVAPVFIGMLLGKNRIAPYCACAAISIGGALGLASALTEQSGYAYAGLAAASLISLMGAFAPPLRHSLTRS